MIRRIVFLLTTVRELSISQLTSHSSTLSSLPAFSAEEIQFAAKLSGGVRITLHGVSLPYDEETDTYYLPASKEDVLSDTALAIENQPGYTYALHDPDDGTLLLYAKNSEGLRISTLVFTNLPVISLDLSSDSLPGDKDESGTLSQLTYERGRFVLTQSDMEMNLRGNTSRRLPKKSYRVKTIDESGEKKDLSLAGLRSDDDWIFNPMYSDTSKIREPLSYWLWDQVNSSGITAASSRAAYAEVLINGSYWGLYGIQERIDRKQVDASKQTDILYKVISNDRPTAQELSSCDTDDVCRSFEISHAGTNVDSSLRLPAAAYISILNGEENPYGAVLSMENTIDYGLWAMLTQAYDCHFKNQFLNCVYTGDAYTMYKIPWDLNHTLGDAWNNDSEQTNYLDYVIGDELVLDGAFSAMLACADETVLSAVRSRWETLRKEALTYERIIEKAYSLHLPLQAALARDSARWPQCGMGDGNALHLRDIEVFMQRILLKGDEFVRTL